MLDYCMPTVWLGYRIIHHIHMLKDFFRESFVVIFYLCKVLCVVIRMLGNMTVNSTEALYVLNIMAVE